MRTARTLMSNVEAVEATKQLCNTRRSGHRIENAPLIEYQRSQGLSDCLSTSAVLGVPWFHRRGKGHNVGRSRCVDCQFS